MIRLVVTAEDFGVEPTLSEAIVRAHHRGAITCTAMRGNAEGLPDASARLSEAPNLGVGVSLALVDGAPVAPTAEVPTLLAADGALRREPLAFGKAWLAGDVRAEHVETELRAQLTRILGLGVNIEFLTTHKDLGLLPGVGQIVERLAKELSIPGIRTSVEPPSLSWITDPLRAVRTGVLAGLSYVTRRRMGTLRHGPETWGRTEAGRLDAVAILEILGRLGPGAHELLCYPTAGPAEPREFTALLSPKVRAAIADRGIVLVRWRDLF